MADASNVPVKIKTQLPEHIEHVQLERYVTVANDQVRRRVKAPSIEDEATPELALCVYHEFADICGSGRLHLSTGALKFEFFRQLLRGSARSHWDAAATEVGGTNVDNFGEATTIWLSKYMEPTAYHDQKQYFLTASKPYGMSCKQLASRLTKIKTMMQYMPGRPDDDDAILPDTEFKLLFYNLMRNDWKASFDASGNVITEDTCAFDSLVTYMAAQERREIATRGSGSRGRGGRGRGRQGGRGRGRGYSRDYAGYRRSPQCQGGPPAQRYRSQGCVPYQDRGHYPAPSRGGSGGGRNTPARGGRGRAPYPTRSRGRGRGGRAPGRGRGHYYYPGAPVPQFRDNYSTEQVPDPHASQEDQHYYEEQCDSYHTEEQAEPDLAPAEHGEHWTDDHCGVFDSSYDYTDQSQEHYGDY